MRLVRSKAILGFAFCLSSIFAMQTTVRAQAWSNGYSYRRMVTIDHTKVPNTDQTNFPVLFSGTHLDLLRFA